MSRTLHVEFSPKGEGFRFLELAAAGADAVVRAVAVNLMSPTEDFIFEERGTAFSWRSRANIALSAAGISNAAMFAAVNTLFFVAANNLADPGDRPVEVAFRPSINAGSYDLFVSVRTASGASLSYPFA